MKTLNRFFLSRIWPILFAIVLLAGLFFYPVPTQAAIVAGFSEYYIPGFSDDLMVALEDIEISNDNTAPYNNGIGDQLTNVVTVSVGGNLTLYYDHWENNYNSGAAGDETFTLTKGQVITFRSTNIPEPRGTSMTCAGSTYQIAGSTAVTTNNCYDGSDRIYVVGGAVSVAQAYWPTASDTNYANAWEIYPIKPYQTHYTIPVGENLYGPTYWDRFSAQSYSNTDGVTNWSSTPWVESGADAGGSPTAGTTWITTGGKLRFEGSAAVSNLSRPVNLGAPVTDAYLRFEYSINDTIEAGDTLAIQVSTNGGGTWITPAGWTMTGGNGNFTTGSGSRSFDLGGYLNANTQIRFAVTGFTDGTEYLEIDNVRINYTTTTNGANSVRDFLNVYVFVQATTDGTTIQIDDPQTSGVEVNVTRNEGQTAYLGHIFAGTTVTATSPVQVQFLIGEDIIVTGQNNSRSYTAVPSSLWSASYYSPVPGDLAGVGAAGYQGPYRTDLYIYNPTTSALTINYQDSSGSGSFSVAAKSTEVFSDSANANHTIPANSGVYIAAADGTTKFWAIGAVDASDPTWNWGYTLLPSETLTDEYYVSWAPGGWNQGTQQPVNSSYSPIYATPVQDNTTVFVDYSPADGSVDATYVLNRIQIQKIYDQAAPGHTADADNTGTHIWATGPIALAWGQDPDTSAAASPGLDAGYTILPMNKTWIDVLLEIEKTADPAIIPDLAGQTSVFTLVVGTGDYAVDDVVVTDTLPANWAYVSGSTTITLPDNSTISGASADPGTSGQDLIWDAFPSNPLDMAANETLMIEFTAITTAAPGAASINNAVTTGTYGGTTLSADDSAIVDISALEIEKISSAGGDYVYPGDTITYTIVITNTGTATQNNIVVSDTLPAGTTYVGSSTRVTYPAFYADYFDSVAYTNSYGSVNWTTSWTETGDDGNVGAGDVNIMAEGGNNRLHVQSADNSVTRSANLTGYAAATLTFDRMVVSLETGETFYLDVYNGTAWTNGVRTWAGPRNETSYTTETVSLPINADTRIRFRSPAGGMNTGDDLFIDNVVISLNGNLTKDNILGGGNDLVDGTPPDLVQTTDNIDLLAGGVMTVTFRVTVDDPVAFGLTSIDNTVQVSSDEEPTPLEDSTSDPLPFASIGNYVWLDENGDGVQDAGESGIPNVVIELYDADGTLVMTTTTDANGGYLFDHVVIGAYTVTVRTSSMPAGLAANPTYDEDDGTSSPDAQTLVNLTSNGQEYMTADFGFNWASVSDVTNPSSGATGAIGDRVWNDADGDGIQDPGEIGIAGVTVSLLVDSNGDGVYGGTGDAAAVTTTTDAAGNYIFDDLPAGSYVVSVTAPGGYTQTGDPDESGTCADCDDQTTTPIVLAPGDVYLNADFGYQSTGTMNTIGNQIFVDTNGDGNLDGGEPGIPGVTVALLDGSGNVIATTVTDASGQYSFTGLPDGTYTVWVNDTNKVLGELTQNSTPNNAVDGGQPCGTCDGKNTVTVSGGAGNSYQDFGYAPADHDYGDGLIGDTIFLDRDGSGTPDTGEGLEGVVVELYDSTGTILLATTTTDENGHYYFGDLPAGDYVVRVDTSTLPAGVTNTVDPDGNTANESNVSLSAGEINLAQDFGYATGSPHTISGTIWEDTDADGTLDGGESGRFQGITVVLYDSDGNVVATTTTDSNGNYSFPGLPDGTYRVDVTDENNVLNGYWHSQGDQSQGSDGTSKADPYTVVLSGSDVSTADFGYYIDPAVIGDYVWLDVNGNGIQEPADEPPIPNAKVTLTITYPNGSGSITLVTYTDENGYYSFGSLLLDENYNGDGSGLEPTFTIDFTAYGQTPSPTGQGTPDTDSNGLSTAASPVQGQTDNSYDSGFFGHVDLGDLPYDGAGSDPDYPTLFSPGPAHLIFPTTSGVPTTTNNIPAVWLGAIVDTEANGQPNLQATGDDDNGDDEDGMTFAKNGYTTGATNRPITITINASASGVTVYYGLWIDWNADGDFSDTDDAFYSGSGVSGSPTDVVQLVNVPASYVQDAPVYFRVRALDQALTADDFEGTFINGEVEDYGRAFLGPTAVRLKDFSTQNKPLVLGWIAVAAALMFFPVLVILRRRKH